MDYSAINICCTMSLRNGDNVAHIYFTHTILFYCQLSNIPICELKLSKFSKAFFVQKLNTVLQE